MVPLKVLRFFGWFMGRWPAFARRFGRRIFPILWLASRKV
jgi:hypothetical protein